MRVRTRWVAVSRSPRPNQSGSAPYAASSSRTAQVSPARPQPRSLSMPPPRVYMQVSRSGQMRRPWSQMSSPTLTTAVTSTSGSSRTPSRKRAPPTPPTRTVTFIRPPAARSSHARAYVGLHRAVVARREAGPEPGTAEARGLHVPHGPLPLRRVRGEHLGEPDVVERAAEQGPADDGGDV